MTSRVKRLKGYILLSLLIILTGLLVIKPDWSGQRGGQSAGLVEDEMETRYGKPLPWEEARTLFPRFAVGQVYDVETGLSFQVQRRGGSQHADVQPITAADTLIMKEIFQGEWSWKRRAIIVETGRERIAASMNGMPHGSGQINNDFNGHFCIHFLNSRVHQSGKIDPAHQLMIWKAAGKPEKPFDEAGPDTVIVLVLTAIKQGDTALASLGILPEGAEYFWLFYTKAVGGMPEVDLDRMEPDREKEEEERKYYRLKVSLYYPGEKERIKKEGVVAVRRTSAGRWLLEGEGLKELLSHNR